MNSVHKGDVVGGVPVEAVAVHVKGHSVDEPVDGGHHVLPVLPGGAVDDGETATDEIILNVDDDERRLRSDNLSNIIET